MALLDGIYGGAGAVQAFGQQQFENKLATSKFDEQKRQYDQSYDESVRQFNSAHVLNVAANQRAQDATDISNRKDQELLVTQTNDKLYDTYSMAGYVSPDGRSLDYKKINADIASGRGSDRFGAAEQMVLGFATQYGNLPEGSEATSVEALDGGGYAITVTNADGSKGVVTEDGSSGPESSVVRFQPGQLGRLANSKFQMEVVTNTSRFSPVSMNQSENKINADLRIQTLSDQEQDFLEDQAYNKSVLAAAESTGNAGLVRGVESAIAEGGRETAQAIGDDLGVPRPQTTVKAEVAQVDDSAPAPPSADAMPTQAPTAPAPWSMDSVNRDTTSGKIIAYLEGAAKKQTVNPRSARAITPAKQTEKLMAHKAELEKTISNAEKLRAKSPNLKIDPEKDGLPKKKAELEQINAYLDKDKQAVFVADPATDALAEQAAGKTTEQIEQGVNDGTIKVDRQTQARIAEQLKREGIREIRDLKRLAAKDAAIARAAIIASSEDISIRKQMATEMSNILDNPYNSPSVSKKDMLSLENSAADRTYKNKKLAQDARIAYRGWIKEATGEAQKVVAGVNKRYFGENYDKNNLDADTASAVMKSEEMSNFQIYLKNPSLTRGEIKTAVVGLKSVISTTMAALSADQTGGAWESILDLIGRGETADVVDPFDFDASRIIVDDPENPTKIYYTDADGNYTDEDAGLQKLKDLAPSFYENVRSIGIANRRARDMQPAAQG